MKVLTLNIWGGRAGNEKVLSFFETYKQDIDIFCLQEVWAAPHPHLSERKTAGKKLYYAQEMEYALQDISKILTDFTPYFRPLMGDHYGLLIFVRKDITVIEEGELYVYREKGYVPEEDLGDHARSIQYIYFNRDNKKYCVINFHGLWNGKGKTDSPDRIEQSQRILGFLEKNKDKEILFCGDFNLLPNTESIKMFEDAGLINLISKYNIQSTRTSYYTKPEKFADYIFVSPTISIKEFKVLEEEVSDHAPLYLECD
jgi:endonuclease/exonuclease/phosphatase family metal-dependent hydrolase